MLDLRVPVGESSATPADQAAMIEHAERQLYRRSWPAVITYPLLIALVALVTPYEEDYPRFVAGCFVLSLALGALRVYVPLRVHTLTGPRARLWKGGFLLVGLLSGLLWTAFCLFAFAHYGSGETTLICLLAGAGLYGGAVAGTALHAPFIRAFLLLGLSPVALWGLCTGTPGGVAIGVITAVFLLSQLVVAKRSHQEYWAALSTTHELRRRARDLEAARLAADEANAAKSRFLANMSHEIRTPLSGIMGMTQLALREPAGADQTEYLRAAHSAATSLRGILDDILDSSLIESGKLRIERRAFGLADVLQTALDAFTVVAEEAGLGLRLTLDGDLPSARLIGDPDRLRQVVTNLIGNAIKFTSQGEVHVSAQREGERITFQVADTGGGISPSDLQAIFEPFVQGDGSSTRAHGGTGLGLSICKTLCSLMGGEIWAESEEGAGSRFRFALPLPPAPADGESGPAAENAEPPASDSLAELRVLVADDNRVNRLLATRLLEHAGAQVVAVENGLKVLEHLDRAPFDVLLLDLQMPELDGYGAAARLRERETAARLPIVAVTAHAMETDRQRCMEAGMDGYLAKPYGEHELVAAIRKVVDSEATGAH